MDIIKVVEQHELWLKTYGREGSKANLEGENLEGLNLQGANLTWAKLNRANLHKANFEGAILEGANFEGANLEGANLYGANLHGANIDGTNLRATTGNMKHIKSVFCETKTCPVTYTAEVMQIGCENHKLEDWWSFDDERIIKMDWKESLKWWRKWKPILQYTIETSPATATGYEAN